LPNPLVVLEPTGGYERDLVELLVEAKIATVVVNAKQVRDFANPIGKLAKTDRIDARCLALFSERVRPEIRSLPDVESRQLLELMGHVDASSFPCVRLSRFASTKLAVA
jgi:transposase